MSLNRREVSIGLAASVLVRCGGRPVNPSPANFPLGVAAGDPLADGALLWTRYDGAAELKVLVWVADAGAQSALEFPAEGQFVRVQVDGLSSATWYRFAFVAADGQRSIEGRFRTAPPNTARPRLRMGAVSCTKVGHSFDTLRRAGERTDLDAFLFLGDTVYADGAKALEDYRAKWFEAFATPEYQALRASTGLIGTWDDHEIANNWGGTNKPASQIQAGVRAFFEHMPTRTPNGEGKVWRSLRFGQTAEVFVLDSRSERSASRDEYVSAAQLAWLKQALVQSTARFKLILTSVPMSTHDVPFFAAFADDRWEGFPAQREDLLRFIDEQPISGVLWVAGDFHLACVGRVSRRGPGQLAREVLVGPGAQLPNVSPSYPSRPQFDWSSGTNNYAELELDPDRGTLTVKWIDGRGDVIHTAEL